MAESTREARISFREEVLPPRDPSHGTPEAMVRRLLDFELPEGKAQLEQTDYGHAGRFNPWEPRQIDAKLQPKTAALTAVAEALSEVL